MNRNKFYPPTWCTQLISAALLCVLLFGACGKQAQQLPPELSQLQKNLTPLRTDFKSDSGRVRLITLLSPT